jgi:hypothetical protein
LVVVLSVFFFWSLHCLSFFFWSLYCLSFCFGHCIVCPFLLVVVLSVFFFWSLYCLSFFELRLLNTYWYHQTFLIPYTSLISFSQSGVSLVSIHYTETVVVVIVW